MGGKISFGWLLFSQMILQDWEGPRMSNSAQRWRLVQGWCTHLDFWKKVFSIAAKMQKIAQKRAEHILLHTHDKSKFTTCQCSITWHRQLSVCTSLWIVDYVWKYTKLLHHSGWTLAAKCWQQLTFLMSCIAAVVHVRQITWLVCGCTMI